MGGADPTQQDDRVDAAVVAMDLMQSKAAAIPDLTAPDLGPAPNVAKMAAGTTAGESFADHLDLTAPDDPAYVMRELPDTATRSFADIDIWAEEEHGERLTAPKRLPGTSSL